MLLKLLIHLKYLEHTYIHTVHTHICLHTYIHTYIHTYKLEGECSCCPRCCCQVRCLGSGSPVGIHLGTHLREGKRSRRNVCMWYLYVCMYVVFVGSDGDLGRLWPRGRRLWLRPFEIFRRQVWRREEQVGHERVEERPPGHAGLLRPRHPGRAHRKGVPVLVNLVCSLFFLSY